MNDVFDSDAVRPDPLGSARAQDALRAALARHASEVKVSPLDPATLRLLAGAREGASADPASGAPASAAPASVDPAPADAASAARAEVTVLRNRRRRRPMVAWVAAAAVLVVAVPLGVALLNRGPMSAGSAAAGAAAGAGASDAGAAPGAAAKTTVAPVPMPSQESSRAAAIVPAPMPGYRYESFLDVTMQVPASWGYARSVDCSSPSRAATGPFVDIDPVENVVPAIGCPGGVPEAIQSEHLTWALANPTDTRPAERTENGWVYSSRPVGSAVITYVHRPGTPASVLDTAVVVASDHNGCPVAAPTSGRPAAVALSGTPSGVVLCEYLDPPSSPGPNLVTSTRLDAVAAAALWGTIEAAPTASAKQPDGSCVASPDATPAVVLRFTADGVEKQMWLSGRCFVPTLDDGATYRRIGRATCSAVYTPPLGRWAWVGSAVAVCGP